MTGLALLSDVLLGCGAIGAMVYCFVLARRLSTFSDLEKGMGGAIAVLSVQVDDLTKALARAQLANRETGADLQMLIQRAEQAQARLEILLACLHDLPEERVAASRGAATAAKPVVADRSAGGDPTQSGSAGASVEQEAPRWRRHRSGAGVA